MEIKPNGAEQEVKPVTPAPAPEGAPIIAPVVPKQEETVGQVLTPDPAPTAPTTVPLAAHLDVKKENKELRKALKDLETKVSEGAAPGEISDDLAAIGDEYGVNKDFMSKLSKAVDAKVKAVKAEVEGEFAGMREEKRSGELDKVFRKHFDAAMEGMPDFKDIANAEVIKTLSLDTKNANKTFSQIIEETYGDAIQGRRTIEPTTPRGGKEPDPIDYKRASMDTTYFREVMADPKRKAEYNSNLEKRLRI